MRIHSLFLSSAALVASATVGLAADLPSKKAAPVDYVKVCTIGAFTGFVIPGSDTCLKVGGFVQIISNGNYRKAGATSERVDGVEYGLGYEYDFGNQWSLRLDYTRTDLDDITFSTVYQPGSTFVSPAYTETVNQDFELDAFRVGLSYRF